MEHKEEFQVGFSSLTRGDLYPIIKIERTETKFYSKTAKGIKVSVLDDDLELITYLPKKLVDTIDDDLIAKIRDAADTNEKYTVCYYGLMGKSQTKTFFGRIHKPGEGRLDKLYNDMTKMMSKYSEIMPEKRKSDDVSGESSCKNPRLDE